MYADSILLETQRFPPTVHPPSPAQRPSPAGVLSQGRCGCTPCQSGVGPGMPLCPGTFFVFPPPGVVPTQPAVAYDVHGHPGVSR